VNISFIATDAKGAVALLRPVFHLCACQNGAKCVQQLDEIQTQSDNRFAILSCECRSGYAGHYCENDVDACQVNLNPCYPGVVCKDLPAPANESGYECGPCPSGLTGKGDSCQDIDECQGGLKRCSQNCYNTPGSFICGCDNGYSLQNDGSTCQDINECQPLADCMQKCENTPGSYQCSCNSDFKVDLSDPKKCIPKFPCKDGSHGCQDVCFESNDVATCACRMGYQLKSDKKSYVKDSNQKYLALYKRVLMWR
ncbi:mucin-like protein, partial [Exaiptasia diaphana]|uniref:EGF-like domain-containing protein n=1 Tax=Exaiptasia diaphana TaxID=2652724 RepID=A0A913YSA1_EXADI